MSSHVEAELLAYLDGELSQQEQARVEAHLAECAACVAELERLQTLQEELGATFDAALKPVRLPAAADARIRGRIRDQLRARTEPRPLFGLWQRRGLIAQAALAVLALFFALNATPVLRTPLPAAPQETLVLGQDRLAPGTKAGLRVIVRSTEEAKPVEGAEVVVSIGRAPGLASVVYTGYTDINGTADVAFTVPEDLEGQASLVVETSSASGKDQIVRPITIAREYRLFLNSDKPAYRPDQTIHLRTLTLDAVDLKPGARQLVTFAVLDPSGRQLEQRKVQASDFGIAAFDFILPPDAAHGQYTLQATLGDTTSTRTVTVGAYDLPAFRITVETDRTFYAPGESVTGFVQAAYFFGKPVADGEVVLRGYTKELGERPAIIVQGETGEEGQLEFTFVLPDSFGQSAIMQPVLFDLETEVVDTAGQREGIRHFVPVAAQPILVNAIPESGLLKPGVENTIFILTAYPDGQPAGTVLTVEVAGEAHTLATSPHGLTEFRFVPTGPAVQMDVSARDAQGITGRANFTFESDRAPQTLLLRAERAAYEVGETLRLEALTAGAEEAATQTVYLDVVRARQTVATLSAPTENGRAVFALDLDGTMVGTLELRAYTILPDGSLVQDTRLVIVDAPRRVTVAVAADQKQYRPGDTAHLQLQTTLTPTNQPVQSALGIGVVDESVYALETLPPGFARAYFLLERELRGRVQGLDVPALLDAETETRASQDVAARAAWAGATGTGFTLSARSTAEQVEQEETMAARVVLANRLGLLASIFPLLLSAVVAQGLRLTGTLGRALRRVGIGVLLLFVASPLLGLVGGGTMWLLWIVLGLGAPVVVLAVVVILLIGVAVHGWRRRDTRVQLATGLLAAYLALGGLLVALAARGGDPAGLLLALIVLTFLLAVAALATLGQGLVLEGWQASGWATTLMALLLIPLVVYLPFVPGTASDLTRTVGNPGLYAGPVGWLAGCAALAPTPEAAKTVEVEVEKTEAPTEAPPTEAPEEPTAAPLEEAGEAPTEAPAAATPTAAPAPVEPFPLRQVFPETLYWNAELLTDENGNLTLDLPLADAITTWRLTALASTQEGDVGFTTYDLTVFQDFFVELDIPEVITQGETATATVTVYNYLPQVQAIRLEPTPADWYSPASPSPTLTVPPNDVATATFAIHAEQTGDFSLQVTAVGAELSDAVASDVTVEP